MTDLSHVPVVE